MSGPKAWVTKRKTKGKTSYILRWRCPTEKRWRCRKVGSDHKRALGEAAKLEEQLAEGLYRPDRKITWDAFVEDHVAKLRSRGKANAAEASQALTEFGKLMSPRSPRDVSYPMVEAYVVKLKRGRTETVGGKEVEHAPNAPATINKKLTYLKGAITKAIRRGFFAAVNPIPRDLREAVDEKIVREVTDVEQAALEDAAKRLYGARWRALVFTAVNTGGRRGELLRLSWKDVSLDGGDPGVLFAKTKTHKPRRVPIGADVVDMLRRLKARTLKDGGPFVGMGWNIHREWCRIVADSKVDAVTLHDLRRTYITRLLRAGVPVKDVMRLVGHTNAETTLRYYTAVTADDLRAAVDKLERRVG